jgi:TonB family protein
MMIRPKWVAGALLAVAIALPVNAQTGPSDARILGSTLRASDMPENTMQRYAVAEFTVSPNGQLVDGRIVESSGDESYDQQALRQLGSSLKGRPAIDADGAVLATGTIRMAFGNKDKRIPSNAPPPATMPRLSEGELLAAEGARIMRMKCKDFLWEYDLLKSLKASLIEEQMPRTAMAVYLASKRLPNSQMKAVFRAGRKGMPMSAEACRQKPDAMFVNDVLAPTFDALMK